MIFIAEARELSFLENISLELIDKNQKKLNTKLFTVKDSSLSYRQINSLDSEDMLEDDRSNQRGWRKFSFKDLVYLYTLNECRKYGLQNNQLHELKDDFYVRKGTAKFSAVDHMLLYVLAGTKISLMINHEGNSFFVDMNYQSFIDMSNNSYVFINFNEIVKKVWAMTHKDGDKKFPKYEDWGDLLVDHFTSERVDGKEKEILDIIRNQEYTKITIKTKGDDTYNVYGESEESDNGITEVKLLEKLKSKDFSNIKVTRRDGKIVNYKVEDVFKL